MGPGNWEWQSPLRHIASGGYNTGDIVNGWRWTGEQWEREGGGSGGGGGGGGATFSFDWAAARKAAFDPDNPQGSVLGQYYLQKLKEAEGDVARAKRIIQEDYDRGVRIAQEDYEMQQQEEQTKTGEERRDTIGSANQRGVLFGEIPTGDTTSKAPYSEYAKTFLLTPMEEKQKLRAQAIERALSREKELQTVGKTRGLEEENIKFPRTQRGLLEETETKAYATPGVGAQQAYTEAYTRYQGAKGQPT